MPHLRCMLPPKSRPSAPWSPILAVAGFAAVMALEHHAPLRRPTQREPGRAVRNLAMGLLSMAVVAAAEGPLVGRLADRVERRR